MKNYIVTAMLLLLFIMLSGGCGNNDNRVSSTNNPSDTSGNSVLTGQFIDSAVEGIDYSTPTQTGTTDSTGTFFYSKGEVVTFSLGVTVLGSVEGTSRVSPIDLVPGAVDETDEHVTNIARLLMFLDADGIPENGIYISQNIKNKIRGLKLNLASPGFAQSPILMDFIRRLNFEGVFVNQRRFVSAEQARAHLRHEIKDNDYTEPLPESNRSVEALEDLPVFTRIGHKVMKFDSLAHPHFVIGGDHLYHFYKDDNGWHSEIIDSDPTADFLKLFIDYDDFIYIFYCRKNGEFQYATNRPGYWSVESLGTNAVSPAVDKKGYCHMVSYNDSTRTLEYFNNTPEFQEKESFDPGLILLDEGEVLIKPSWMALTIDDSGGAHMVYTQTGYGRYGDEYTVLRYATNANGSWHSEEIAISGFDTVPKALDIVTDRQGIPHIGYGFIEIIHGTKICFPNVCDDRDQLDYFTKNGSKWESEIIDGRDTSDYISLDSDANGHINRIAGQDSSLYYATNTSGAWQNQAEFSLPINSFDGFSTAIDPSGQFGAVSLQNGTLIYTSQAGSAVSSEIISEPEKIGDSLALARDIEGSLHVCFWDSKDKAIKYASQIEGSWVTETVSSGVETEPSVSIALDPLGHDYIGFATEGELIYLTNVTGEWQQDTISANFIINLGGMVVDGDGKLHTLYYNSNEDAWMHAELTGGTWKTEKIVNVAESNLHADMAISPTGTIYICFDVVSYLNELDLGLWLGWKDVQDGAWHFKQLEKGYDESYCDIVVDDLGIIHLAYRKADLNYNLRDQLIYATETSTGWIQEVVDQGSHVGQKISLGISPSGIPVMSYYGVGNGKVVYSYRDSSGWISGQLADLITYGIPNFRAPVTLNSSVQLQAIYFDHNLGDLNVVTIRNP